MILTREEEDKILKILIENRGDYAKAAKESHYSSSIVRQVDITRNKKYNYTPEGRGPKHLQKYIVATTKTSVAWDNTDEKIKEARQLVDEGKGTMCTGRDGMNLILYYIPKVVVDINPKPYFTQEEETDEL